MRIHTDLDNLWGANNAPREKVAAALRCLILVTVFLMARTQSVVHSDDFNLVVTMGAVYVLLTTFLPLANYDLRRTTLSVLAADIFLITALLYFDAGIASEYYLLYYLPILHASVRLNLRDAMGTCLLSAASYLLVGMLQVADAVEVALTSRILTFGLSSTLLAGFFFLLSQEQQAYKLLTEHYQRAVQAKNDFLSHVSHEFRTPLTAIVGFSQLLYENDESMDAERQREYLAIVREQSQHLARLIEDTLDLSRLEDGRLQLRRQEINLVEVVASTIHQLDESVNRNRIQVITEPGAHLVYADPGEIEQALSRLLYRALSNNDASDHVANVTIWDRPLDAVQISIQVPGMKADSELIAPLTIPSHPGLAEEGAKGRDLGLTVARALIELHEGRIWVEDNEEGAIICFTLPSPVNEETDSEKLHRRDAYATKAYPAGSERELAAPSRRLDRSPVRQPQSVG